MHLALRLVLRSASWRVKAAFTVSVAASAASYAFLHAAARPSYGAQGELLDGGGDLRKGLCDSATDVLLLTAGIHILSCFSDWAWLLALLVPAVAMQWLWANLLRPFLSAQGAGEEAHEHGVGGRRARRERDAKQKHRR